MAISDDEEYVKKYLNRVISLSREIEGQAARIGAKAGEFNKAIIDRINNTPRINSSNIGSLNKQILDDVNKIYEGNIKSDLITTTELITSKEMIWNVESINTFVGLNVKALNPLDVSKRALKKTYNGHTFNFWTKNLGDSKTITKMLRQGYELGSPPAETARAINNLLGKKVNSAKAIARGFFQHAAIEARSDVFNRVENFIEIYFWVSTLDGRTTPLICGVRDMKKYTKQFEPIGHSLPWGDGPGRIHWGCRSNYIAQFKGQGDLGEHLDRHAFGSGENYESGDNKTKTGRVRKPTRKNVEDGTYSSKRVKASTNYEANLRKQNVDYIADVLNNKEAAKKFKSGELSLLDFIKSG